MEGFLVFLVIVVILGVVIWLLSWLAGGLLAVLGGLLAWLAALWPGWPGLALYFAIATVFAAHRLLSLPFRVSHFRVDRNKAAVKPYLLELSKADLDHMIPVSAALPALDCLLLFLVLAAIEGRVTHWSASGTLWALAWIVPVGVVFFFWCIFMRMGICPLFVRLAGIQRPTGKCFRFVHLDAGAMNNPLTLKEDTVLTRGIMTGMFCGGTFLVLAIVQGGSALLFRGVLCFLVVDAVFMTLEEIASFFLDWRNDRWVNRLALQLTDDQRPDQRRQAAEKLETIGPWALPARPSLEKALQDENETVRHAARKALARVK